MKFFDLELSGFAGGDRAIAWENGSLNPNGTGFTCSSYKFRTSDGISSGGSFKKCLKDGLIWTNPQTNALGHTFCEMPR